MENQISAKVLFSIYNSIANFRSTYMNYPGFQFSINLHIPNEVMAIVKFVPLVLLMEQVVETHMATRKSLQTTLKCYISYNV